MNFSVDKITHMGKKRLTSNMWWTELTTTTMEKKIFIVDINRHLGGNDSSMFTSNQNKK